MSLLSICRDVADVIGLTRPAAIMTGPDQLSRQMLGFAKETLEELGFMDWPILEVAYSFNTVVSQSQYALPVDFGRAITDTMYAASRYEQLRGSLTPGDWARQRNNTPELGRFRFRIFGNPQMLNISPTPTVVEAFVMEYQTINRVTQVGGAFQSTYFSDDDVSLVPEDLMKKGLKWRLRRAKGLDYSEEFDDYETARTSRLAQQLAFGSIPISNRSPYDTYEPGSMYVRENGYGA